MMQEYYDVGSPRGRVGCGVDLLVAPPRAFRWRRAPCRIGLQESISVGPESRAGSSVVAALGARRRRISGKIR
jgi:hypothetical protein